MTTDIPVEGHILEPSVQRQALAVDVVLLDTRAETQSAFTVNHDEICRGRHGGYVQIVIRKILRAALTMQHGLYAQPGSTPQPGSQARPNGNNGRSGCLPDDCVVSCALPNSPVREEVVAVTHNQ